MNRKAWILALVAGLFTLGGCGGDDGGAPDTAPAPAPEQAMAPDAAPAPEPQAASSVEPGRIIDHTRDEAEFRIRKALNGVEAMLEDARAEGWDTAELQEQQQALQRELEDLLGSG